MARASFRTLDPARALERIVMHLAAARDRDGRTVIPGRFTEGDTNAIRLLPPWVSRAGLLRSRSTWWLWCDPRRGAPANVGQFVIEVPPGRYMVDILDTRHDAWFSRESAAASPLVAGLPATGHALLVRIRRISAATARPRA